MARSAKQHGSVVLGSIPTTLCPQGRKNNVGIEPGSLAKQASTHYSIASGTQVASGHLLVTIDHFFFKDTFYSMLCE